MRWAEITAECAPEAVDAVSYAFLEAGCGGVLQKGGEPAIIQGSLPVSDELTGRLDGLRDHLARLEEFGLPPLRGGLTLRYAEDEDWANEWKKYFKPLLLGRKLVVKPSWEDYTPKEGEVILELDPGMAFGTGGHPTTKLCIQALEDYVTPGMTVADIGTGSGILSLAAAKLGATRVYATDIDIVPRKIARENIERNNLASVIQLLEMDAFDAEAKACDLIVANIVAHTIVELAPSVAPRLNPGGIFITSGIVEEHHGLVSGALEAVGFTILECKRDDIWVCFVARLTGSAADTSETASADELPPITRSDYDWAK